MSRYTGTARLTRAALRRDRIIASVWVALLTVVAYASAAATASLYPTLADQVAAARGLNASPAIVALYGPILDEHSLGELAMTKMTVLYAVFVALLVVVVVRRHTRLDEENGRAELLGGTAIGPDALLAAAVVEGVVLTLAIGVLAALADIAGGLPVAGSIGFGAAWAGIGWVSIGLAAVACQVSASSRTCFGIAGAALGALYGLRAVGDVGPGWLSWLSPFGWSTRLRVWSEPRWWVLLLFVALGAALVALAVALRARRDLGAGLLASRPGPAAGSPRLADALALAWRVQRASVWSWTVAVLVFGALMGAIAPGVGDLLETNGGRAVIESLGGVGAPQDALLAAVLSLVAVLVTCFALTVVGHGAADEHDGRTEQVLATATSRSRALVATSTIALLGAAWLLVVTGVATAAGLGTQAAGDVGLGRMVGAALDQVPAVWVVVSLALLLYAVASRWSVLGWAALTVFVVVGQLGELLRLPDAVIGLSPFTHVPAMPVEAFAPGPAVTLIALAVSLWALAWWRFRERDIG